jgi:hypothetical protein
LRAVRPLSASGPKRIATSACPASDVDQRVGQRDIDQDVRIGACEVAEQRHDAQPPMRQRRTDPQPSARRALVGDLLLGIVEIGEDAPGGEQIGLPFGGERQRAGGAEQQSHAQTRLDPVDRPRHRRRRQPERAAGGGEAAFLHHASRTGRATGRDRRCQLPLRPRHRSFAPAGGSAPLATPAIYAPDE